MKRLLSALLIGLGLAGPAHAQGVADLFSDSTQLLSTGCSRVFVRDRSQVDAAALIGCLNPKSKTFDLSNTVTVAPSGSAASGTLAKALFNLGASANVLFWGADPTGVQDSCAAQQSAVAYLKALAVPGGRLYWPAGSYRSSCATSVSDMPFEMAGDGQSNTKVTFTTPGSAGLKVTQSSGYYRVGVRGIQLIPGAALPNDSAITVTYPSGIGPDQTVSFHDFIIQNGQPAGNNSYYFGDGVVCTGCTGAAVSNWRILGRAETPATGISATNMGSCFSFKSYSSNVNVTNGECNYARNEFTFSGGSEGQKITNTNGVAVNYCFYNDDASGGDTVSKAYFPAALAHTNHCDSFLGGAVVKGWSQAIFEGNEFYKRPEATGDWIGYNLDTGVYASDKGGTVGTLQSQVKGGNCFAGTGQAGTATCVRIGRFSQFNLVQGVHFQAMTWFADTSHSSALPANGNNVIRDNTAMQAGTAGATNGWITNPAPTNVVFGNLPVAIGTEVASAVLTVNSNNPTIGGINQRSFRTANTATTAINHFDSGQPGDVIRVRIADAYTTFVNDPGNLELSGGTTTGTLRQGQVFTFMLDGTVWREMSRTQ